MEHVYIALAMLGVGMGIIETLIEYYNNDPVIVGAMYLSLAVVVLIVGGACVYLMIGIKNEAAERGETLWEHLRKAFRGQPVGAAVLIITICLLSAIVGLQPITVIMLVSLVLLFEISRNRKEQ